jgi:hypothetical protein
MLKAKKMKQITNPPLWHTDSAFTTLAVENGQVDMAAVTTAYNQLLDSIRQHYYGLTATDKQFVFANVELIPTGLKTSEVTLKVTSGVGEASTVSPLNFGPGDNWIWGWDQGKCDGTSVGQDATDKFEQKINLRIAAPANSYFDNFTTILYVNAHDFPNPDIYDPHPYMMYTGSDFSDCIEWEDMNFYLAGQVHILFTQMRPSGKLLISYDIHEELFGSGYLHCIENIRYGQPFSRPPGGGEDL